jgi:hypothetical protein
MRRAMGAQFERLQRGRVARLLMPYRTSHWIQWVRAISSPCERSSGCALIHVFIEQIVHSGEHQAVDQKSCCEEHEFRKQGIHKVSSDGLLKPFICGERVQMSLDQRTAGVVSLLRTIIGTGTYCAVFSATRRCGVGAG